MQPCRKVIMCVPIAMCALQKPYADLCGCVVFINPAVLGKIKNNNIESSLLLLIIINNFERTSDFGAAVFLLKLFYFQKRLILNVIYFALVFHQFYQHLNNLQPGLL